MIDAIGKILGAVAVAVVSGLIIDWWTGWRGKRWLFKRLTNVLRLDRVRTRKRRLLIFVSASGTCRDPMAKVIAERLIEEKAPELRGVVVEGRALMDTPKEEPSHAARIAVREIYGDDLLRGYAPRRISEADKRHADLILVMAEDLLHKDTLPEGKTYLFKEFFGSEGDIEDPWPDGRDQLTLERYRRCADELMSIMGAGLPRLVRALGS